MAKFLNTCQRSLESVKKFLGKVKADTTEVDRRLENVNKVVVILSDLSQDAVLGVDQKWPELARKFCKILVFGDWMRLTITMACQSSLFNEIETQQKADESSKLPPHMQTKVDEITEYLKKCRDILKGTDEIVRSLIVKARELKKTDFKGIPDEDIRTLQMDVEDMECNLEMSKTYLDSASRAFDQLKSDLDAETWSHQVKVFAIATGCIATFVIGGVVLSVTFPTATQTGALKTFIELLGELGIVTLSALTTGGGLASAGLALFIYCYMSSYGKEYYDLIGQVQSDLQVAKTDYKVQEKQFKIKLKERMKR